MTRKVSFLLEARRGSVSLNTFLSATGVFLSLLHEVETTISKGAPKAITWGISDMGIGSTVIVLEPIDPPMPLHTAGAIIDTVTTGLIHLEMEPKRPTGFSDRAIRYANRLAFYTHRDFKTITIKANNNTASISPRVATNTGALLGKPIDEFGVIEGVLKMVSIAGSPRFNVYNSLTGLPITCHFNHQDLSEISRLIGKRIQVTGRIVYNRDGNPKSVRDVTEFYVFPDDRDLPTGEDLLNSGFDPAGTMSTTAFMESYRNG